MKRQLYLWFLILIKPARLFRLTWVARLYMRYAPGYVARNRSYSTPPLHAVHGTDARPDL